MITDTTYDVFVSYDHSDRPFVVRVAEELEKRECACFVDQWHLRLGCDWVDALERALATSRSVAVFLGPREMGSWQQRERAWALDRQAHDPGFPVVPVLLPDSESPLGFLKQMTWIDLRGGPAEAAQLDRLAAAIQGNQVEQQGRKEPRTSICPYRGLRVFREEDAPFFFGRDAYIGELLDKTEESTLVAVVGDSGSGKSSVVRAGLVPRLRSRGDGLVWEIVTMVPGDDPLHALAGVLLPLVEPELTGWDLVRKRREATEDLRNSKTPLRDLVAEALRQQKGTERLLLVVDQWEELYTLCEDSQVRQRFIEELLNATASRQSTLSVVLTLRADFFRELLQHRVLLDRLKGGLLHLGPMNHEELQAAVEKPAANVGLTFQDGLVERLLEDARDEPGRLPLLEFALEELWKRQSGGQLTHSAYEELGRLSGAIATRAETIYARLDEAQQAAVPGLFRRLVRASARTEEDTRRRADFRSLSETSRRVARLFADKRLLVTTLGSRAASAASGTQTEGDFAVGRDGADQPDAAGKDITTETVEVAHEALLRQWGRLKQWIDQDRKFLQWRARLAPLLEQYHCDAKSALLRHGALREARQFYLSRVGELEQDERSFVHASLRAERGRKQRFWGVILAMVGVLSIASLWIYHDNRRTTAENRVESLVAAAPPDVRYVLSRLDDYSRLAIPILRDKCNDRTLKLRQRVNATFAIARLGTLRPTELQLLLSGLPSATPQERGNYYRALSIVSDSAADPLMELTKKAKSPRTRARYALTALSLGSTAPAKQMTILASDPSARTEFIHHWEEWPPKLSKLPQLLRDNKDDDAFCSAVCCGLGLLNRYMENPEEQAYVMQAVEELHRTAPGVATHGSSAWMFRAWQVDVPVIDPVGKPPEGQDWFVNAVGMTMLKIPPGSFVRKTVDWSESQGKRVGRYVDQTVTLTWPFLLADREVSRAQFEQFERDPEAERLEARYTSFERRSGKKPTTDVNWFDAVLFCNWLSRKEGLTCCYEPTGETQVISSREYDVWRCIPETAGYRLPTEAEWEHACRARSRTAYCYGDSSSSSRMSSSSAPRNLLSKYAVSLQSEPEVCGRRIPNGWGLFDMHGNVSEWCQDPIDGSGLLTTGSYRVIRGGSCNSSVWSCESDSRDGADPSVRRGDVGFRVARSLPGSLAEPLSGAYNFTPVDEYSIAVLNRVGAFVRTDTDGKVTAVEWHGMPTTRGDVSHLLAELIRSPTIKYLNLTRAPLKHNDFEVLGRMADIEILVLSNSNIDDRSVHHLSVLGKLRTLDLSHTGITDVALTLLSRLSALEQLSLSYTQVTDEALLKVKKLKKLRRLCLDGTRISDEGLKHLVTLANLEYISLAKTDVTTAAIEEIADALPGVVITDSERLVRSVSSSCSPPTRGSLHALDAPVKPGLLDEDAPAFVDRNHEYGGADLTGMPDFLKGAEYIRTPNDAKAAVDFVLEFELTREADIYLLIDNRIGVNRGLKLGQNRGHWLASNQHAPLLEPVSPSRVGSGICLHPRAGHTAKVVRDENATDRIGDPVNDDEGPQLGNGVMQWVVERGFEDTGLDIGLDEDIRGRERSRGVGELGVGPGESIQGCSSIFVLRHVAPGRQRLMEQNDTANSNMYGVAVVDSVK